MVGVPTPTALPFKICVPGTSYTHCVNTEALNFDRRRDCESGQTPKLATASLTYAKKKYTWQGLEVVASQSVWFGVEMDLGAVWVGESTSNQCARIPINNPPSPTAAIDDIVDEISSIKTDLLWDIHDWGGPHPHSTGGEVLGALILVAIAIAIAAPPTGAPG